MRFLPLLLSFSLSIFAVPCFSPPSDWEMAIPKKDSPFIQVAFLGKSDHLPRPKLNLAIEEIDVSAKEYLKAVKELHIKRPNTTWRDLGPFKTKAGPGRLTEIITTSVNGAVRMLQLIVVKDSKAYIMTGASAKEDFIEQQQNFIASFHSLSLLNRLFDPLSEPKKEKLTALFSHLGSGEKDLERQKLEKLVTEEYQEMGSYWSFLVLKEGCQKIFTE
jgi:hypothetical protein